MKSTLQQIREAQAKSSSESWEVRDMIQQTTTGRGARFHKLETAFVALPERTIIIDDFQTSIGQFKHDQQNVQAKVVDSENCSRRNILFVFGIPEEELLDDQQKMDMDDAWHPCDQHRENSSC